METDRILHICARTDWESAVPTGSYLPAGYDEEGFIHCSTLEQVVIPANALFRGQTGLVLLVIHPSRLSSPVVYEDCYESGIEFPHVYGPIEVEAVESVVAFEPGPDGTFDLPLSLAE